MVIATSGYGNKINYNRIISSTSSYNLNAAESKSFRDTSLLTSKKLKGLFIIDKDNLVALIWDSITQKTDIATLNMASSSVTYKSSLPIIQSMRTSVFVRASIYYTPSYHSIFYKDYTNTVSLNTGSYTNGIVYSSDISLNSCYKI